VKVELSIIAGEDGYSVLISVQEQRRARVKRGQQAPPPNLWRR